MSMTIERDGLQLCTECTMASVNGDTTSLDFHYEREEADRREREIYAGLEQLGPHLVPDWGDEGEGVDEFSTAPCDCCGTDLAGRRDRFAVLAPVA